jgi:hypothetical protein
MVHRAEREPTMEEIVVALRETRRAAGRSAPFTVVDGQRDDKRALHPTMDAQGATDIGELRDTEIQRLLGENTRLNERVIYLLKVLEHQQSQDRVHAVTGIDGETVLKDVRTALETELRPILDVLLRLLEKLRGVPAAHETSDDGGIIDLDAPGAHE